MVGGPFFWGFIMPVKNEESVTASKIVFGALAGIGTVLSMGMFWWFTGVSAQLSELQISMVRNSEIVNNLKEKIEENLKTKEDVIQNSNEISVIHSKILKIEQELELYRRDGFHMRDYEKYVLPSIEELHEKISKNTNRE
jgi:hypothetical protein